MSSLNIIKGLFLHYLTRGSRPMTWVVYFGLALALAALLLSITLPEQDRAVSSLAFLGYFFTLLLPFTSAGKSFKIIASNRQFSLAPKSKLYAFLALLLLTILVSSVPPIVTNILFNNDPWQNFIWIFGFSSAYLALCQFEFPTFIYRICFIMPLLIIVNTPVEKFINLFHSTWPILLLLTVIGWCWAFKTVNQERPLKKTAINSSRSSPNVFSSENNSQNGHWSRYIQAKETNSPKQSLYFNILLNQSTLIKKTIIRIVFFPFLLTIGFTTLGSDELWWDGTQILPALFLGLSAMLAIAGLFMQSENIARSKFLWLRYGNSRLDMWRFIEENMFKEYLLIFIISAVIVLTFYLFGEISIYQAMSYLIDLTCLSVFFTYFPLYCSIKPNLGRNILWLLGSVTSAFCIIIKAGLELSFDSYQNLLGISVLLLTVGLFCRYLSIKSYMSIDWLQVKPKITNHQRLLTNR